MATINRFEDIEAWKLGRELKRLIYASSKIGAFSRDFALKDQIRRAAISITANIAEGFERDGSREFRQFLSTAKGSCGEVQDHLYTALDEAYLSETQFRDLHARAAVIGRKIGALMIYLRNSEIRGRKFEKAPAAQQPETRDPRPETHAPSPRSARR